MSGMSTKPFKMKLITVTTTDAANQKTVSPYNLQYPSTLCQHTDHILGYCPVFIYFIQ